MSRKSAIFAVLLDLFRDGKEIRNYAQNNIGIRVKVQAPPRWLFTLGTLEHHKAHDGRCREPVLYCSDRVYKQATEWYIMAGYIALFFMQNCQL